MENLVVELARYILVILIVIYTLYCFTVFRNSNKKRQSRLFLWQIVLMYCIHFIGYMLLYLNTHNIKILQLYILEVLFLISVLVIYRICYPKLSKLLLHNMLMLLSIGFVMLTRLSYDKALKQFVIGAAALFLCCIIPYVIPKFLSLSEFGWVFAAVGIVLLLLVVVFGEEAYGAVNWVNIKGITFQPSEFVKILFVFFVAALLSKATSFKQIILISAVAAVHVLILVAEKDLGGALIYFVTYIVMLYVATRQPFYFVVGILSGSVAATFAYKLFAHVRVRVVAWKNPWKLIDKEGYQITQSLFAIGTGGWFGLGLGKGLPNSIPVVTTDFIFSAISEELGAVFAFCIILIYFNCFIMFINIAMKLTQPFYKLTAFGLSVMFIFQVFLTLGGATKFIPSTGVTLPLISYGGSSILSSIIIFNIIQGLYVLHQKEEKNIELERKNRTNHQTNH